MKKLLLLALISISAFGIDFKNEMEKYSYSLGYAGGIELVNLYGIKLDLTAYSQGYKEALLKVNFSDDLKTNIKQAEEFDKIGNRKTAIFQEYELNKDNLSPSLIVELSYAEGYRHGGGHKLIADGWKIKNIEEVLDTEAYLQGIKDYFDGKDSLTNTEIIENSQIFLQSIFDKSPIPKSEE